MSQTDPFGGVAGEADPVGEAGPGRLGRAVRRAAGGDHPGEAGTALPPFIDHHVHLMLTGIDALAGGALAGVVDLGAPPELVARVAASDGMPRVRHAGAFVVAEGGYPSGRPWALPGSVHELPAAREDAAAHFALPSPVRAAVAEQAAFGAAAIKTTLHVDHGPTLDDARLAELVDAAHEAGLPLVAHVEGAGTAARAILAGVDVLAHTPFSERLDDALVARAAAAGQAWISTLWIHGYGEHDDARRIAVDNLARFHAAGGRVLYGTDLGNGERAAGLDAGELAALLDAGLAPSDLVAALADPWPCATPGAWGLDGLATFVAGDAPSDARELPAWLASARLIPIEELEP